MTEIEMKAEQLRQSAEAAKAEAKAAKEAVEAVKAELAAKDAELKQAQTNIDNLDASVKEQSGLIEGLKEAVKVKETESKSASERLLAFIEEHKAEMEEKMSKENGRFKIEFKDASDITRALIDPNYSLSLQKDNDISAAKRFRNTFLEVLGLGTRTADKLAWVEGTTTEDVDYVDENAQNTHKGDSSIAEVQRGYGKLQTSLILSTEVSDWYGMFRDWAISEARAALMKKLNEEVWKGVGADTSASTKKKIYGVKTHSTAFAPIAAVSNANVADVIFNCAEQVANAGYMPDVAFVSPAVYFALRNLKTTSGAYILDRQTDILCSDNREIRVIKAHELSTREIEVMDSTCCKPFAGNSFEFEGVRDADYDRWKFFFRICGQNKIKTDWKKGMIYVADANTAVTQLAAGPGSNANNVGA